LRAVGAAGEDQFRYLGADRVVLIGGQADGGQDADDGNNDHQFDQGEAVLLVLHVTSSEWSDDVKNCGCRRR